MLHVRLAQTGSRPITFLWLWPATDHEPHCRHVPVNKIWRRTEPTLRSGRRRSHMAGIYSDCSDREITAPITAGNARNRVLAAADFGATRRRGYFPHAGPVPCHDSHLLTTSLAPLYYRRKLRPVKGHANTCCRTGFSYISPPPRGTLESCRSLITLELACRLSNAADKNALN